MTQEPAIIGFRQDRVGARITGIVSLMRLAHAFGATTRFAWLAQPDGPWPELSDPTAFFTPDFVASHIVSWTARRRWTAAAACTPNPPI